MTVEILGFKACRIIIEKNSTLGTSILKKCSFPIKVYAKNDYNREVCVSVVRSIFVSVTKI